MAGMQSGIPPVTRRADAGTVRLSQRDITGLILCAEHYAAPYDLLAAALGVQDARLRGIVARWRSAGYAVTGRLGPGPAWCWLTPAGMAVCGLSYQARPPALARLAHIRAVLAARLWLEQAEGWREHRAWWHSERRIRADDGPGVGHSCHLPDAEVHWPSLDASPYAGQLWAVECELTPQAGGPHHPHHERTAVPGPLWAGGLPGLAPGPVRRHPRRRELADGASRPGSGPRPARIGLPPGAAMRMSTWSMVKYAATLWLLKTTARLLAWLAVAAVAVAAWPVTAVAALGYLAAWLRGWPPARLYRAALWSLFLTAVYLLATALQVRTWQAVAWAPVRDWLTASRWLAHGRTLPAALLVLPVAVPAGLATAGLAWAWRIWTITTGTAGRTTFAPVVFDARQWRRQARAARGTS